MSRCELHQFLPSNKSKKQIFFSDYQAQLLFTSDACHYHPLKTGNVLSLQMLHRSNQFVARLRLFIGQLACVPVLLERNTNIYGGQRFVHQVDHQKVESSFGGEPTVSENNGKMHWM